MVEEKVVVNKKEAHLLEVEKVRSDADRVFYAIKDKHYKDLVSDCYTKLDVNVAMVCKSKYCYGLIISGVGGTGKTYRVVNNVAELMGKNFVYIDSKITPGAFIGLLFKYREGFVIIIDDVSKFFDIAEIQAYLKSAMWHGADGFSRVINSFSTKDILDPDGRIVPPTFIFNSKIIIITNKINDKNAHISAILSRVNHVKVDIPRDELFKVLDKVASKPFDGLSAHDNQNVLFKFKEFADKYPRVELNIRTLLKMLMYYEFHKSEYLDKDKSSYNPELFERWSQLSEELFSGTLDKDSENELIIRKIMSDVTLTTPKEREAKFSEITGKHKSQFHRWKTKYGFKEE